MDRFTIVYTFGAPTAILDRITTHSYDGQDLDQVLELLFSLEDETRNLVRAWNEERTRLETELEELNWQISDEFRQHEELVDALNHQINTLEDEVQSLLTENRILQSQAINA